MYHFQPRPYQEFAIWQIIKKPACALMLDMGMGKTASTLMAIKALKYDYFDIDRVLIIAPKRVAESTWVDEVHKWYELSDLRCSLLLGTPAQRIAALKARADIYIINRENLKWLYEALGGKWPFDMVVIDESSSFKNAKSQRFRVLRRVRPRIKRIVELTGTPTPNGLMDLWSQLYLLDGGKRLGKYITQFRNSWFYPASGRGRIVWKWGVKPNAEKEILDRISDICVSMKSEDYLTLPPVMYNTIKVKMSSAEQRIYRKLEKDMVLDFADAEVIATSSASLSMKLLQLANGAIYDTEGNVQEVHDAKLEALEDLAESANTNLLVFYWFKHDLVRLKKKFPDARQLNGKKDIEDWNNGKISMMLVHPASAGHGLNLQYGGSTVVWFGLNWSLELYQQANKRLHRSGQEKPVIIHHLVTEGSVDEDVMKALSTKAVGQDAVLEAVKARIERYR